MEACAKRLLKASYVWIMARKEHWATGLMVGLTAPVTLFLANPEWTVPAKLGAFAGFASAAAMYVQQNGEELIQFGLVSAISLFLVAVVLFHGATTFNSGILAWAPVFICATLMTAVNIAPKVAQAFANTWRGLPITINIGHPYGIQSDPDPDPEQGQGRFMGQDEFSEAEENQTRNSSRGSLELNSVAPTTSSIRALLWQIDGSSGHDSQESSIQIKSQVETTKRSILSESPPWSPASRTGRYPSPVCSAVTMSSSRRVESSEEDIV